MQYIWKNRNPKLKHTTLCNEYERGLKNLDIFSKITSLKCSLFLIKNHLGRNFVFHSNLSVKQNVVKKSPKFYQEILTRLGKYLSSTPNVLSVACQFIWYNEYIKIDNNTIWNYFSQKKLSNPELEWKDIYIYVYIYIYIYIYTLPRHVTINTNLRIFQYKLLHNILYLNEMLYKFGKKLSPLKNLKSQFTFFNVLIIPPIMPQSTIFGFIDHKVNLVKHYKASDKP